MRYIPVTAPRALLLMRSKSCLPHSGPCTPSAYLGSCSRICDCSGCGIATVWRYIVINVAASLETLTSAERNCLPPDDDREAQESAIAKADNRQKGESTELCSGPVS